MAKSASKGSGAGSRKAADKTTKSSGGGKKTPRSAPRREIAVRVSASSGGESARDTEDQGNNAADMFLKLLQSPIVADLLAVAATAALAALAEHGFNRGGAAADQKRAGKAVKAAGKAAAAAIGRRLATEIEEIRKAAKTKVDVAA